MLKGEPFFVMARPSFLLSFYSDLSDNRTLFDLFPDLPSLQRKDHIRGSFKESDALFPAHPAAAVLQADKLLLHLPPAVWTDFVACTHASPCTSVKRINDKLEFLLYRNYLCCKKL